MKFRTVVKNGVLGKTAHFLRPYIVMIVFQNMWNKCTGVMAYGTYLTK